MVPSSPQLLWALNGKKNDISPPDADQSHERPDEMSHVRLQLQPICTKLEKLQDSFQSREELISQLETTAADAQTTLGRLKLAEEELHHLRSENNALATKVRSYPYPSISQQCQNAHESQGCLDGGEGIKATCVVNCIQWQLH